MAVAELRDAAVVMPEGSVLTRRDELVVGLSSRESFGGVLRPDLPRLLRRPPRDAGTEPVALLSNVRRPSYYHWWVDCLPRIWLYDERSGNPRCPLIVPAELEPIERELLELLGVADRLVPQEEAMRRTGACRCLPGSRGATFRAPCSSPSRAGRAGCCGRRAPVPRGSTSAPPATACSPRSSRWASRRWRSMT